MPEVKAISICRWLHSVPCDEVCGWCLAEAEIEAAARQDDTPGRTWPIDEPADADL